MTNLKSWSESKKKAKLLGRSYDLQFATMTARREKEIGSFTQEVYRHTSTADYARGWGRGRGLELMKSLRLLQKNKGGACYDDRTRTALFGGEGA